VIAQRAEARRTLRRQALLDAAVVVFTTKGVSAASVDDIVRQAGAAKGTFYLYFRTKAEVVDAVAASMVSGVADAIESSLEAVGPPVDRIRAMSAALRGVGGAPYERELVEAFHRPENRAMHDRLGAQIADRLAPALRRAIADGIAAGEFAPQDPDRAARYALACFAALHDVVASPDDLREATAELDTFVLRGLGWEAGRR
jgi:AcrR family transcriptional regulator